jgi:D-threo-aldose 1-dehydrogenase
MFKGPLSMFSDVIPVNTLPLGFGCGGLHGGQSKRESLALLETAIDCGITYFDTARLYGLGDAEGILGELARYRHSLIITSKAGILPADRRMPLRLWNRGTRMLHNMLPGSARYVAAPVSANLRFHAFSRSELFGSVETSLRQLRTDYVDILLLHECSLSDVENPDVLESLEKLQQQGKIRAFGIASGIDETLSIISRFPKLTDIIQIPSNIVDMNIKRIPCGVAALKIIHSCLKGPVQVVLKDMLSDESAASKFTSGTGVDPHDSDAINQLVLAHALGQVPLGIVLFSTSRHKNIRSNVRVVKDALFDDSQVAAFASLVAEWNLLARM